MTNVILFCAFMALTISALGLFAKPSLKLILLAAALVWLLSSVLAIGAWLLMNGNYYA